MEALRKLVSALTLRQRVTILAAVALVVASLWAFARWSRERDFKPLYTALAAEDAGAVLARLRESGVDYRLSENGSTVLVPSARVAEVRLQMATAGLPKTGRIGYELFDKTNFGSSDFAEQVNFHRAIEGELERSVMSLAEVEQARVHVSFAKESVFLESRQPAKASVLVKLRAGAKLSPQNVSAICHLAASAVQGLDPEAVSVLDMRGTLLSRPRRTPGPDGAEANGSMLEFRQDVERDLLRKVNATLDPLLGPEKFRASVSVDCDFTSGEQSEESFDPSKSVMTSSQRTEDIAGSTSPGGVPGTAANLPRPTSRPGSASGGVTRRTENILYQSSRVVRRLRLPQGAVKRVSVSVLVDHAVRWEGSGAKAKRVLEPPPAEKLKVIRDVLSAAAGLQPGRGDQLIVESLPFESTLAWEPPPAPAAPASKPPAPGPWMPPWAPGWLRNTPVPPAAWGGAVAVLLALVGLLWARIRRRRSKLKAEVAVKAALPAAGSPAPEDPMKKMEAQIAARDVERQRLEAEAMNSLKLPPVSTKKGEVLTRHIAEETKKNPVNMAQILRSWLSESES